ncbi:MAG: 2-dehydropantoate 2-reductase [Chloroflexi bacterium]|nr:2-dehydropantoate 2-reductase [Chloroflexota bacterium]
MLAVLAVRWQPRFRSSKLKRSAKDAAAALGAASVIKGRAVKSLVVGAGGMGGYFGAKLAHAGGEVTFMVRESSVQHLRDHGIQVFSPDGDFTVRSFHVTDDPAEVEPVGLVLLCVKSYDLDTLLAALSPVLLMAETVVIPLLNGIGHVPRMQEAWGADHVLGGLAYTSAHKGEHPGVIHHMKNHGASQIEFGEWRADAAVSPRCEAIQRLFSQAGVTATAVTDIEQRMWWKLAAFTGSMAFAVARGSKGKVWSPELRALICQLVAEVVAVARAQDITLPDTLPEQQAHFFENAPAPLKPSLLIDLEQGRRLEVETTVGFTSRLGKELAVDTRANDFVYACLKPYANGVESLPLT